MANKKVYSIQINGIDESVKAVDTLTAKINEIAKTINELKKEKIEIPISIVGSASDLIAKIKKIKDSSTLTVDSGDATLNKLMADRAKKLADVSRELGETTKTAKEYKEETKKLVAEELKARNEAKTYANTMDGLKAELKDLNSIKGSIDLGSEEFITVSERIYELNAQLKDLEAAQNSFGRNVGNYTNSIKEASTELNTEAKSAKSLADIIDNLNKKPINIKVGDAERSFSSTKEAARTLNNEAKTLGIQLEQLKKEGKDNTDEFNTLQQQFLDTASAADEFEHVLASTSERLDSLKDDSGAIGTLTKSFEAFSDVAEVGVGVMGLFGQSQEDVQKAINRTVQVTTILNGVRKLLDKTTTSGIILNKTYQATLNTLSTAFGVEATSATVAATATRAFAAALTATGIGALVLALGYLIDKVVDFVSNARSAATAQEEWSIKMGDAIEVMNSLNEKLTDLNNLKVDLGLITNVEGAKANFDLLVKQIGDFEKEVNENGIKLNEHYRKIFKIDLTNANEVTKWLEEATEVTSVYEKNLEKCANANGEVEKAEYAKAKASLELYKIVLQLAGAYDKYNDEIDKSNKTKEDDIKATKTATKTEKDYASMREKIANATEDNIIEIMKDGVEKQIKLLETKRRRALLLAEKEAKDARLNEKLKQEYLLSINKLYDDKIYKAKIEANKNIADATNKFYETINNGINNEFALDADLFNKVLDRYERSITELENYADRTISPIDKLGDDAATINAVLNLNLNHSIETIDAWLEESRKKLNDIEKNEQIIVLKNLQSNLNSYNDFLKTELNAYKQMHGDLDSEANMFYKKFEEYTERITNNQFWKFDTSKEFADYLNKIQSELLTFFEDNKENSKDYNDQIISIFKNLQQQILLIQNISAEDTKRLEDKARQDSIDLNSEYSEKIIDIYRKQFDEVTQLRNKMAVPIRTGNFDVDNIGNITQEIISYQKLGDVFDSLKIKSKELQEKIEEASDPNIKSGLERQKKEIDDFLAENEMSVMRWVGTVAMLAEQATNAIGTVMSNISEAQYNREVSRIERQEDLLDKELDEIGRQLDKKQELYEKYNDAIEDMESELSDARGSRRQMLIDNLAAEQQAQMEVLAQKQALEKAEEDIEKKRQKLEQQKELAEKKRNKAQQKIQTAMAIANTATAVTNALAVQPWFLGAALAAVAAAMGASEIATIKSVKYANGGLLEGKSHAQGGMRVGNSNIEVEGGEYVINKKSTAKNLPLIQYINESKKELTAEELVRVLSNNTPKANKIKTKFADGGQLPTLNTETVQRVVQVRDNASDNRPIYVRVTDINSANERLAKVRSLSGRD